MVGYCGKRWDIVGNGGIVYLSGFLFGNLRLLVEDLCQTLLSLGIFGLYNWLSLRWFRLDSPVAEN